ncbi:MAG: hypothetical protein ABIU87_09920 [Ornithinibacter sp.]
METPRPPVTLISVPFVDRNPNRSWRARPLAMALGLLAPVTLTVLTIRMLFTPAQRETTG